MNGMVWDEQINDKSRLIKQKPHLDGRMGPIESCSQNPLVTCYYHYYCQQIIPFLFISIPVTSYSVVTYFNIPAHPLIQHNIPQFKIHHHNTLQGYLHGFERVGGKGYAKGCGISGRKGEGSDRSGGSGRKP